MHCAACGFSANRVVCRGRAAAAGQWPARFDGPNGTHAAPAGAVRRRRAMRASVGGRAGAPAGQGKPEAQKPRQVGRGQLTAYRCDRVVCVVWVCMRHASWHNAEASGPAIRWCDLTVGFLMAEAHIRLGNWPLAWTGRILFAASPKDP